MTYALFLRHAELVSASMAWALVRRSACGQVGPWTLKQVQGNELGEVA
jgi:hypothetical protein